MPTITERLRGYEPNADPSPCAEAADVIDKLAAALEGMLNLKNGDEVEKARAALSLVRQEEKG